MSPAQLEQQTTPPVPSVHPGPSPQKLFETMTAYQQTAALRAAVELDLFTAIGEGQNTVPALARRIKGVERAVRILCDCLVVTDFSPRMRITTV